MRRTASSFDAEYYRRFYEDPATCAVTAAEYDTQIAFVAAYLRHLGVDVRRVLDLGCGMGLMREPLARHFPGMRYHGVELSAFACERYGWTRGSVVDFRAPRPFDLVICHDVLQYLGTRDCAAAIANLARLTRRALLLAVMTREDWDEERYDPARTDAAVRLRETDWYRARLRPAFVNVGGGLLLKRDEAPVLWTMEHID